MKLLLCLPPLQSYSEDLAESLAPEFVQGR